MSDFLFNRSNLFLAALGIFATGCSGAVPLNTPQSQHSGSGARQVNAEAGGSEKVSDQAQGKVFNGSAEFSFQTTIDDGLEIVDVNAVQSALDSGYSNDSIIATASSKSILFSEKALSLLGLSKFTLQQYRGSDSGADSNVLGLAAVNRARAAGLKDSEIIGYAKLQNILFGEQALTSLGLTKFVLRQYRGVDSGADPNVLGLAAVDRARAAGLKNSEIIAYAKLQNIFFGEQALTSLGLTKSILRQYRGADSGSDPNVLGLAVVNRARAAGLQDSEIVGYAKLQNIFFGEQALTSLGLTKYVLLNYRGADSGAEPNALGLAAVDRARAAGLKDAEIIGYAKLQNVLFGEQALSSLGLTKYVLLQYRGASAVGDANALGLAAVDRARAAGLSDSEIIAYGRLQGIVFGDEARRSLKI